MIKQGIRIIGICVFLYACQSGPAENTGSKEKSDSVKVERSIRSNMSFLNDLNAMEQVFGNENWLLVDKKDSSYYYFSRLGDFTFNSYVYKLVKGDSAKVDHGSVQRDGNNLTWKFDGRKLVISSATRARVVGSAIGADSVKYEFVRLDNEHISITFPDNRKLILQKTLPFSLFLIRSRYDYAHGTKYAFDSTRFNKRR